MTQPAPADVHPADGPAALALALLAGLAWVLSQPPVASPLGAVLVVALWLAALDRTARARRPRPLLVGAAVGTSAFAVMVSWLALPAGWLAVALLSLVQGLWVGAASWLVLPWLGSTGRRRAWVAPVAAVAWTGMEVARARVPLGGFGWGDLATGHAAGSPLLGTARVLGADGVTLLSALAGALLYVLVRRAAAAAARPGRPDGVEGAVVVLEAARPALLGLVGVLVAGLLVTVGPPPTVGTLDLVLVQGNDGTRAEVGAAEDLRIATALADTTIAAVGDGPPPDLVVWPEYALDRDVFQPANADLAEQVERVLAEVGAPLVAGVRRDGPRPATFSNEMVAFEPDGAVSAVYAKQQRVPFGEYVPWRSLFGGFPPLARQVPSDAVAGPGPATLRVAGVDVATAICFETLFGPLVREGVRAVDAAMVLAVTNDASYGVSPASEQHVAQSRLRAVETGRTVVHASLSGVSAVVAPDGGVVARAGLFDVTALRVDVPLVSGSTPALSIAPWLTVAIALLAALLAAAAATQRLRRPPEPPA